MNVMNLIYLCIGETDFIDCNMVVRLVADGK